MDLDILKECLVCQYPIKGNSVLFHCECVFVICQDCALLQVAAQRGTYTNGLLCPYCRRPSDNIQNIDNAKTEESSLIDEVFNHFKLRNSRSNDAIKRALVMMLESGITGTITLDDLSYEEMNDPDVLPCLRLELARLECRRKKRKQNLSREKIKDSDKLKMNENENALDTEKLNDNESTHLHYESTTMNTQECTKTDDTEAMLPLGPLKHICFTRNMILEKCLSIIKENNNEIPSPSYNARITNELKDDTHPEIQSQRTYLSTSSPTNHTDRNHLNTHIKNILPIIHSTSPTCTSNTQQSIPYPYPHPLGHPLESTSSPNVMNSTNNTKEIPNYHSNDNNNNDDKLLHWMIKIVQNIPILINQLTTGHMISYYDLKRLLTTSHYITIDSGSKHTEKIHELLYRLNQLYMKINEFNSIFKSILENAKYYLTEKLVENDSYIRSCPYESRRQHNSIYDTNDIENNISSRLHHSTSPLHPSQINRLFTGRDEIKCGNNTTKYTDKTQYHHKILYRTQKELFYYEQLYELYQKYVSLGIHNQALKVCMNTFAWSYEISLHILKWCEHQIGDKYTISTLLKEGQSLEKHTNSSIQYMISELYMNEMYTCLDIIKLTRAMNTNSVDLRSDIYTNSTMIHVHPGTIHDASINIKYGNNDSYNNDNNSNNNNNSNNDCCGFDDDRNSTKASTSTTEKNTVSSSNHLYISTNNTDKDKANNKASLCDGTTSSFSHNLSDTISQNNSNPYKKHKGNVLDSFNNIQYITSFINSHVTFSPLDQEIILNEEVLRLDILSYWRQHIISIYHKLP